LIQVNYNFFGEKHGKSGRDEHFSNVERFVQAYSLKKRLVNSHDIVEAIMEGQKNANDGSMISC
jgi:hypothetical protein